jgi:hypothetical protein
MFLFLIIPSVYSCFNYTCGSTDPSNCAEVSSFDSSSITLNQQGCPSANCNRTDMEVAFDFGFPSYPCPAAVSQNTGYNLSLNTMVTCPSRHNTSDYNQSFAQYLSSPCVDLCHSESGTNTSCLCGFDGNLYCMPNRSSSIFQQFWDICTENNNTIDQKTLILWDYWLDHFVEMLTAPFCADGLFTEIDVPSLDYLIDAFGFWPAVGLVGVILML